METKKMCTCVVCGRTVPVEDALQIDGNYYCTDTCATIGGYNRCEVCGEYTIENLTYITDIDKHVCLGCYHSDDLTCFQCNCCGAHFSWNEFAVAANGWVLCDACHEESFSRCESCGTLINLDTEAFYLEEDDFPYCERCISSGSPSSQYASSHHYDYQQSAIHNYSFKPNPHFKPDPYNKDSLYIGVELEVDNGRDRENCAIEIAKISQEIYCKNDGSLNYGIEIVSHPCTLAYHENELKWRDIMATCLQFGFRSHDTRTCGIHAHVNRSFFGDTLEEQDMNIAKLILLVNRFWDSHIVPFTRRKLENLRQWGRKNEMLVYNGDTHEEIVKKSKVSSEYNRYVAINLTNRNTIEFRIFRGTLKYSTFVATLQFVDTICRFAKEIDVKNIDSTSWEDIFKDREHEELKVYMESRTNFDPKKVNPVFYDSIGDALHEHEHGDGGIGTVVFSGFSGGGDVELEYVIRGRA